ncbi:MAG: hypothetical protein J0L92_33960 [Deltaproteobacteria bacterium]|nr:hypothetical protein [Deltaproteobacteria bacterium]
MIRASLGVLAVSLAVLSSGCRTPQSLCTEYFDRRAQWEVDCYGEERTDRMRFCQDDDEVNCGCGAISVVENPSDIVTDCFGYFDRSLERDMCPPLEDYPMNLPEACNPTSHFFYVE